MARSRYIKHDFFLDEDLAELPALTRLFFIGTWTIADRNGVFEDRPRRIFVELTPWEPGGVPVVEKMLEELAAKPHRSIVRYEVDGKKFCWIRNFKKYQSPHRDEPARFPLPNEAAPCESSSGDQKNKRPVKGQKSQPTTENPGLVPPGSRRVPPVHGTGSARGVHGHSTEKTSGARGIPERARPNLTRTKLNPTKQNLQPGDDPLSLVYGFGDAHRGKTVGQLDPDYCEFALDPRRNRGFGKLDAITKSALRARIDAKKQEVAR